MKKNVKKITVGGLLIALLRRSSQVNAKCIKASYTARNKSLFDTPFEDKANMTIPWSLL